MYVSAAVRANTQVLIIGHMPPCLDYFTRMPNWQRAYAQRDPTKLRAAQAAKAAAEAAYDGAAQEASAA